MARNHHFTLLTTGEAWYKHLKSILMGFSTEFGKSLDYLNYLCFTFFSTLARQSSPLLLSENELLFGKVCPPYSLDPVPISTQNFQIFQNLQCSPLHPPPLKNFPICPTCNFSSKFFTLPRYLCKIT